MDKTITVSVEELWALVKFTYQDGQGDAHDESTGWEGSYAKSNASLFIEQHIERSFVSDLPPREVIRLAQEAVEKAGGVHERPAR